MSAIITTRTVSVLPRYRTKMVGMFYLLTFLMGGFFFLAGGKVGFVVDVTAAMFYIAATALFYAVNNNRKTD